MSQNRNKALEKFEMRYLVAYPTGRERIVIHRLIEKHERHENFFDRENLGLKGIEASPSAFL
jgi:hypothetical protein